LGVNDANDEAPRVGKLFEVVGMAKKGSRHVSFYLACIATILTCSKLSCRKTLLVFHTFTPRVLYILPTFLDEFSLQSVHTTADGRHTGIFQWRYLDICAVAMVFQAPSVSRL
jgi:hypothetical protein